MAAAGESAAVDVQDIARTLNTVRRNGEAWSAAIAAKRHGIVVLSASGRLPGDYLAGGMSRRSAEKTIGNLLLQLDREAKPFESPSRAAAPVNWDAWQKLRRTIERIYIESVAVFAAAESSPLGAMARDIYDAVVRYGDRLIEAGVAAPGVLLGDVVRGAGKNVNALAKGGADAASMAVEPIADGILGLAWRLLPLALVAGAIVFIVIPEGRKALLDG